MLTVEMIDTNDGLKVNQFVRFHYKLYRGCPQWVPPFRADIKMMLDRKKHPFYEHSDADFFLAYRDGEIVGRLAALENKPFNKVHESRDAEFYLFDSIDDQEVANALFERAFEWARARKLNKIVGPKGFSPFDGYGIQIEGMEYRQMMTMMNYNYPYYRTLVENLGFEKEVDFVSCDLPSDAFHLPEKAKEIARRVKERGTFQVLHFASKTQMIRDWAPKICEAYNKSFVNNWEYYPLTQNEVSFAVKNVLTVADHRLIKIITHNEDVVGFLFAFPDISPALQRGGGRLTPWAIADMLIELKRTRAVSMNGAGVLPEYHGRGGAALMYSEMEDAVRDFNFQKIEMTQVAETAVQMRQDLINLGGKPYKNHRVYRRMI
jgi:GNAT superfamily N-acetyltransferase